MKFLNDLNFIGKTIFSVTVCLLVFITQSLHPSFVDQARAADLPFGNPAGGSASALGQMIRLRRSNCRPCQRRASETVLEGRVFFISR